METMTLARLAEFEKLLAQVHPAQPVRIDVFELRQLVEMARLVLEAQPQ